MRLPLPGRHIAACLAVAALLSGCTEPNKSKSPPVASERGAQLFKERCAACHPDGGNVINPKKTLHGGVLADHGITTPAGIVARMRTPGPGMTRFDQGTIPDADARLIAEYILATFR
ncbi:c-type cytochrome [Geomonas anaerohicana]|uniref:c-type cytochrome n=1 Tax=Geomonas anaerohicana TaxID=2798583 RepID=UPI002E28A48F|nr:c-type cytochrome [Geomonas anaerohicana]